MATPMKSHSDRDWTVADAYELLPESGTRRFEIIDGELVVSPTASRRHQRTVFEVAKVLDAACPAGLRVSGGPVNLDLGDRRHLEPDLVVERVVDIDQAGSVPVLIVEVLSPSNRRHDTHRKRAVYEELGVASYWLVDPLVPSVAVLDLEHGTYVETAHIGPGSAVQVARPFPVRLAPSEWSPPD
ncbi:MAG: Uma2 family endonuclease [Sporichthyaceae bacterium]|nr:Uma2 family endonuclease [Sporichthyaceae bacterium]